MSGATPSQNPPDGVEAGGVHITGEEIEEQSKRILASEAFRKSPRISQMLEFIIRHSVDRKRDQIKEYTIARDVFGQTVDFQTGTKSVVRMGAARLREKLVQYYQAEGVDDPILIELPVGTYVPQITLMPPTVTCPVAVVPDCPPPRRRIPFVMMALCLLAAGCMIWWVLWWLLWRSSPVPQPPHRTAIPRRLLVKAAVEGKSIPIIEADHAYTALLLTPDGQKLYAFELGGSVAVIDSHEFKVKRRISLPRPYRHAFMARDGRHVYISSTQGGVMILDTVSDLVTRTVFDTGEPVYDVAVSEDNRRLFLALGYHGLKRFDLNTGEIKTLSSLPCPLHLDINRAGALLYVAYECGGPGGRSGHDSVVIYNVATETSVGKIAGPPMVSDHPFFAADDEMVLLNMRDACLSPEYDHVGCEDSPVFGFHLWRPSDQTIKSYQSRPKDNPGGVGEPFPRTTRLFLATPAAVTVMDWARGRIIESVPIHHSASHGFVAMPASEERAFVLLESGGIGVLDAEEPACQPSAGGLMNFYTGDGTPDDALNNGKLQLMGEANYTPGHVGQALTSTERGAT